MKKERIYQNNWLKFHPYPKASSADVYYVQLANKVYDVFKTTDLGLDLPVEDIKDMACAITAYFEDVISGIGMFKTFTRKHRELYGSPLPFFAVNEDEYFEDEINEADIRFLLWHYMQQTHGKTKHSVLNPDNKSIYLVALKIWLIFEKEYETAPENKQFRNYFTPEHRYNEYYALRQAMQWLQRNSYLFFHQELELVKLIDGIEKSDVSNPDKGAYTYSAKDSFVHNVASPLLAMYPNEWFSEILTPAHPDYKLICTLGRKKEGNYLYLGKTETHLRFRNLITDEELLATKDSFEENTPLKDNQTIIVSGFIRLNNEWWMTGAMEAYPYSQELEKVLSENAGIPEDIQQSMLKKADNQRLHYFGDKTELFKFFEKVLGTEKHTENETFDESKNLLAFVSTSGIIVFPDICDYIKDERNPYYNEKMARAEAFSLYVNMYDHPIELVWTLHNNQLLPDAQLKSLVSEERGKELIQGNAGFIMRYFYREKYRIALEKGAIQ